MVVLLIGLSAVSAQQAPSVAPPTGLIAGRVFDITTGEPVAGVTVSMSRPLSAPPRPAPGSPPSPPGPGSIPTPTTVQTDSQGRFAFSSLTSGRYSLRVQQAGYAPVRTALVNLAAAEHVADVILRAGRHGSIAGTVRDDAGDAIVGISVRTFNRRSLGVRPVLFPRGNAVTDDRGQFRIGDLPAGDYLVCACGKASLPFDKNLPETMASFTVPAADVARRLHDTALTFAPTFHPGNTRIADALPITVSHGDSRQGVNITMLAVTPRRVSGRIAGGEPNPGSAHKLLLFQEDEDPAAIGISEITPVSLTPQGEFEFVGVTPGRYTLEAYPASGKGQWASVALTVSDRDVTDVLVTLTDGATLTGRLEFAGSALRPDGDTLEKARVGLSPVDLTPAAMIRAGTSGSIGYSGTIDRNGSFTIRDVPPGRYLFGASGLGAAWQTVESVSTGDGRQLGSLVRVDLSGTSAVVVTMSDVALATLEGTITLERYESPNDTRVLLFPADRALWTTPFAAPNRFVSTGASNTPAFTFRAVPPGDYHAIVVDQNAVDMSADRLSLLAPRAMLVTLRAGETTTVTLKR